MYSQISLSSRPIVVSQITTNSKVPSHKIVLLFTIFSRYAAHLLRSPDGLPYMSNFYCLSGKAGGTPNSISWKSCFEWMAVMLGYSEMDYTYFHESISSASDGFSTDMENALGQCRSCWHGLIFCRICYAIRYMSRRNRRNAP